MPSDPEKIQITTTEVNRPGLHMAGYFEFFDEKRIQIIGKSEESFLLRFTTEKAEKRLGNFFPISRRAGGYMPQYAGR